jgi:hypothetical protein
MKLGALLLVGLAVLAGAGCARRSIRVDRWIGFGKRGHFRQVARDVGIPESEFWFGPDRHDAHSDGAEGLG